MIKSTFDLEKRLIKKGYRLIIGIDEAGRGPLAGPVVAAAATVRSSRFSISNFQTNPKSQNTKYQIQNTKYWDLIRDSKTLSHKQRESLYDFIHEYFYIGVGICDHKTIDRINILEATFLAMKAALSDLRSKINYKDQRHIAVVDGNKKISNLSLEQKAVPGGDRYVKSISAASIIAKVTRDRIMREMHKKYPQYNFDRHKGYGTKMHFAILEKNGPCKIHRRSFAPVKKLVKKKK